ncbi:MAG: N-acetylmuramoyl-L-alanine amidase family protein [Bacillota bacterium]
MVKFVKIVIDAGHGGNDPGAVSNGVKEKIVNIKIVAQLYLLLLSTGYNVKLTRSSDEFISLANRVKIAKEFDADIFVSIHTNAFKNKEVEGIESYYGKKKGSFSLGESIQNESIYHLGALDRGVKNGEKFYVLKNSPCPSVLVECGFLTNNSERILLQDDFYQKSLAYSIFFGIKKFIEEGLDEN